MEKNREINLLIFFFAFLIALVSVRTGPSASDDSRPPAIELQGLSDSRTVYTEKIYIAGQVIDDNTIKSLTLNGSSILDHPGRSVIFSHLAELKEGNNRITIEAVDSADNRARQDIVVIRKKIQLSQLPAEVAARRLRVAIYPFEKNGSATGESAMLLDLLTLALQTQGRFQLVDRGHIERILEEQKLNLTQLVDENAAVKLGKLMSAQAVVTGSITETGNGTEIVGRVIDTETSEILATEKIYSSGKGLAAMSFLAEALSVHLHNDFPMLSGIVLKQKDGQIYTDLKKGEIAPHGRLVIYRSGIPEKGPSGPKGKIIGYARVTEVMKDMSKAEVIKGSPDEIRTLDRVIVQ
ncbi:MAG: hypothetical protein HZB61_03750 [Nitrospirae bacterium]|nr:hypothetical protein [Nitrospirota bacterium]